MIGVRWLKGLGRWVLLLAAFLVITVALLVSIGRETINNLDSYRTDINDYASDKLGLTLETERLLGEWHQLTPQVMANGLSIYSPDQQEPAITVNRARLDLDLIQTLLSRQLVWRELRLGQVALTAKEDADGNWSIAGLPLNGGGGGNVDELLDVLLYSEYLQIRLVSLTLDFFSGTSTVLEARNIQLENSNDFHRLLAAVTLAGNEHSAELVIEGRGDHRDLDDFEGLAYLKLNRINFSGSLNALAKGWFPEIVDRVGNIETDIDGEVWISAEQGGGTRLVGRLSAAEIPLNWLEDTEPLTNFKADLTGWFDPGKDWGLRFQGLDFDWGDLQIEPLNINFLQRVGAKWGTGSLTVSQINLGLLDDVLAKTKLAPEAVLTAAQQLQPTGNLRNLHLELSLENQKPEVRLSANLDDISVASWRGAPAARQVNGYLEVANTEGFVLLDSPNGMGLYYPQVFDEFMEHSSLKGQVNWRWDADNSAVKVVSGPLEMGGEEGWGRAFLYLDLPVGQPELKPQMYLSVGVKDTHGKYRNRYLPKTLNKGLLSWLDSAIGDVRVPEVGFIWRGPLVNGNGNGNSNSGSPRSIQLYLRTEQGELKFQSNWPALEQLDSIVTLDGGELDAEVISATLGKTNVQQADILLRKDARDDGLNLLIDGLVTGDLGNAVDVLAQSPLKSRVAGLDGWQLSGNSKINLDLTIPLSGDTAAGSYIVDTHLDQGLMALPDTDIAFKQLQGVIKYRDGKGLFAETLTGRFWGEPLNASFKTLGDELSIDVNGGLSMPELATFLKLPSDQVLLGNTKAVANLRVPLEDLTLPLKLQVDSQLKGAVINLPSPFGKTAATERAITTHVTFARDLDVRVQMNGNVRAHMIFNQGSLSQGLLTRNSEHRELPEKGHLLAVGNLEYFSLAEWLEAYPKILDLSTDNTEAGTAGAADASDAQDQTLTPVFEVTVDVLDVAGLALEKASVNGGFQDGQWMIGVESDRAEGHVLIPQDETLPMLIDLERLALPTPTEAGGEANQLDPTSLPHMQVSIRNFNVGERRFGEASLLMEPQPDGVRISNIDANLLGLQLGGKEHNTSLEWRVENDIHQSAFEGLLRAGDVGEVMKAWGLPEILDSDESHFFAGLSWEGRPWEISPLSMNGTMSLYLEDGRFYKSPTGAANAMIRLVGLFNFGNWVRRLQLDFSDLFEKGMSYDEMSGGLVFDEGELTFDAPLEVKLPSGRIKMAGTANLVSEQLDTQLVTTLPVGTNLPWVAAAVGGLPAAAGVYATSKLFKKQVDKLSSISYRVSGSWNDPEIEVQRIFSDSTKVTPPSNSQPKPSDSGGEQASP